MPYFDVKQIARRKIYDGIGPRSINLMCAMLEGITYNQLYGEPFHHRPGSGVPPSTLDRMIDNINNLHLELQRGAATEDRIVVDKLAGESGAFVNIRNKFVEQGYPELRLRTLFYQDPTHGTTQADEVARYMIEQFEAVHTPDSSGEDQMYHFCVPFLTVRKGRIPLAGTTPRPKRAPQTADLDEFLQHFGVLTMRHLYDVYTRDYCTRRPAAQRALDRCILKEHGRPNRPTFTLVAPVEGAPEADETGQVLSTGVRTGADGDYHYCGGTGTGCLECEHQDDWCNDFISGGTIYCSLGSDTH